MGRERIFDESGVIRPPEEISILWCPSCGRDDRFQPFTGKSHYRMYGIKCDGQPTKVTYSVKEVAS